MGPRARRAGASAPALSSLWLSLLVLIASCASVAPSFLDELRAAAASAPTVFGAPPSAGTPGFEHVARWVSSAGAEWLEPPSVTSSNGPRCAAGASSQRLSSFTFVCISAGPALSRSRCFCRGAAALPQRGLEGSSCCPPAAREAPPMGHHGRHDRRFLAVLRGKRARRRFRFWVYSSCGAPPEPSVPAGPRGVRGQDYCSWRRMRGDESLGNGRGRQQSRPSSPLSSPGR